MASVNKVILVGNLGATGNPVAPEAARSPTSRSRPRSSGRQGERGTGAHRVARVVFFNRLAEIAGDT